MTKKYFSWHLFIRAHTQNYKETSIDWISTNVYRKFHAETTKRIIIVYKSLSSIIFQVMCITKVMAQISKAVRCNCMPMNQEASWSKGNLIWNSLPRIRLRKEITSIENRRLQFTQNYWKKIFREWCHER
jgi:hypothetical protein